MITHLVDSDRLVDYLNDKLGAKEALDRLIEDAALSTSIIVIAEVREGVLPPAPAELVRRFEDLRASVLVHTIDDEVVDHFIRLRSELRRAGKPIGDHDLWIAATALRYDLTLVSRDTHFDRIPQLKRDAMLT